MIRFVDLFAGTGGIRLGFQQALEALGMESECVLSSEINPKSRETYQMNFSEIPQGDVRDIVEVPDFDFLLAGFPCQPFSYAGKQKGFADTRGTLFFEIERILASKRPSGFLLENVRGLTTHDGGRTFATILKRLESLNYHVKPLIINASTLGVPQNRVRVYILGSLAGEVRTTLTDDLGAADSHKFKNRSRLPGVAGCDVEHKVVADILEDHVNDKYLCSAGFTKSLEKVIDGDWQSLHGKRLIDYRGGNSIHSWDLGLRGECSKREIEFMNLLIKNRRLNKFGNHQDGKRLNRDQIRTFFDGDDFETVISGLASKGYIKEVEGAFNPVSGNMSFEVFKFLDPESVSITLVSSDAHRLGVVQGGKPRRITPREAARLQGYPDSFVVHPNDQVAYFQFGNAVAVPVVEAVVRDFLNENDVFSVSNVLVGV